MDFPSILKTFPQGNPLSSCLHSLPKKDHIFPTPPKTLSQEFAANLLYFPMGRALPFPSHVTRPTPAATCHPDRSLWYKLDLLPWLFRFGSPF